MERLPDSDEIRNKIKRELGITVSVGLANKIFAKWRATF